MASGVDITFDYATSDFTASAGEDYTDASGQLTIPAGATQAFIPVPLINDTLDELEETFTVTLSGAVGGGLDDFEGMATISDNDAAPQVSIGDATVTEGTDFDTVEATFDVTLDAPSGQTVTVDYSTTNGTATEPGDYTEVTTSTVVFAPGQTTQPATVIVNGDDVDEANETFSVDLANPSEATIGDGHAVGTIIDNDGPAISIDNVSVTEGNVGTVTANFTLSLSAPSPQEVTVEYETIDDTATAGEDYVAVDAVASFASGQTEQQLSVTVNGDTADELDESFFIALSGSENGTVATELAQGTILNDDTPPTISITDATVLEGNSGSSNATFTVSLSGPSSADGDRQLRQRHRNGDLAGRLRRRQRNSHLRSGRHLGDDHGAGRRRSARRGQRELHDRALQPGQRNIRRQPRFGHDHRQRR